MDTAPFPLSPADLMQVARNGLRLPGDADIRITEVTRWTNLNHIFLIVAGDESIYVKVVTATPKLMKITLPRERIFFEAEAIGRFRALCGPTVVVPEVLFVDREAYALGMSDVGRERRVLIEVIDEQYALFVAQAVPLGTALGNVHSASRGSAPFRPEQFERMLQAVIVEKLLAPGARALFDDHWPGIAAQMSAHRECLIHGDLWAKNVLVGEGVAPALVDFEGASIGDPAFDIATLLAVAAIPALEQPELVESCVEFSEALIRAYRDAVQERLRAQDSLWVSQVCARAYLYVGTFLAARGFGPFLYPMSEAARNRLARLARSLSAAPVNYLREYSQRLVEHGLMAEPAV